MKELYINGIEVPLDANFGVDYVKEIADIENPDQRRSDYSKTIRIVGTKAVNKLFNHIYDINVDSTFNPQKKADAVYYEDSIEQLRGFFRLVSIEVDNDVIIYNGTLHGELSNIFKDMGDSLISELDWTDLDHTYNELAIRNSWVAAVGVGYFYPMIDYNGNGFTTPNAWAITDFRPAVWFLEIWDRIFSLYGYTYDSTFITPSVSSTFDRLLMPAKSEVLTLTTQVLLDRSFNVGLTAEWLYPQDKYGRTLWIGFDDDTPAFYNTINNDYGVSGTTLGRWTCGLSGTYVANINIQSKVEWTAGPDFTPAVVDYNLRLVRIRGGGTNRILDIVVNDAFLAAPGTPMPTGTRTLGVSTLNTQSFEIIEGDQIYLTIENIPTATGDGSLQNGAEDWSAVVDATSSWGMTFDDNVLTAGSPISISSTIPNMKQKDFVMGVIKAFNLYVEQTGEKNLLVEAREDYYIDTITDWTNKKNGGITIEPNKQLQGKQYNFKFQKEGDYLHERYLDNTGMDYGDLLLAFDNDFKTSIKDIELPFGSTLLTMPTAANDRPVASLYYIDPKTGLPEQGESKPRMVYYGGMIPSLPTWVLNASGINETTYPYVGDTWSPYGVLNSSDAIPSILNFQRPVQVYYDGDYPAPATNSIAYGGRTLYSQYEQMIADIQNPVITCKMFLHPMDIYNLSFRNKYFIDTAYFRLLRVSKEGDFYNCEFLKIE